MKHVPLNRVSLYAVVAATALAIDLTSKQVVFNRFGVFKGTDWLVNGWLRFRLHTSLNEGALWGVGQGFSLGFAVLSVGALAGIGYWLFWRGACESAWLTFALALVSGGTIGNLYDRLGLHGLSMPGRDGVVKAVRDFLHFQLGTFDWAIFNIADMCLVTGAIMLMLQSLLASQPLKQPAAAVSK